MAQPATEQDQPKARILQAARAELSAHGARRLTVVLVAERAGMTHANVYRYFASKTALIDAVTSEWLRPLEVQLAAVADAPDPTLDKIERMVLAINRAYREVLEQEPHLFEVFVDAFVASRGTARKHRARVRGLMERVVEEGIASDALGTRDPARAMALVLDATFRFIHPGVMRLDLDQGLPSEARLLRVLAAVAGALRQRRLNQ
jgi:AcrR family transcriptional regulator